MDKKVGIVMTTYNNGDIIAKTFDSIISQDYKNSILVVADDGSTDKTYEVMEKYAENNKNIFLTKLPHLERGIARKTAIDIAKKEGCEYLFIIDSDMKLKDGLIFDCVNYLEADSTLGALVIPEIPFSDYNNYFSKVRVFEREIINNAGKYLDKNSIEAARFWKMDAYDSSGGLNPNQIAFEETQPTIRYVENGGKIERAVFTGVHHDEKMVTLKNLVKKKSYYFSVMPKTLSTEKKGMKKALARWYFFRPVLYRGSNILRYIKHPLLAIGMFYMYIILTFVAVKEIIKNKN